MQTVRALLNLITIIYFKHVQKLLDSYPHFLQHLQSGKTYIHGHTVIEALCQYEESYK